MTMSFQRAPHPPSPQIQYTRAGDISVSSSHSTTSTDTNLQHQSYRLLHKGDTVDFDQQTHNQGGEDRNYSSPERRATGGRKGFNLLSTEEKCRPPVPSMIDNSGLIYIPMELQCGVTAQCRPDVLARCPSVLRDLNSDLMDCLEVLPRSVHGLLKRTNIWVNTTYYYGTREKPRNVNHSTAHHHEGWLIWVRDKPEKALGIEIYNCFDYQKMRLHWNGCGLLLHELCHLIHQLTLPDGLENAQVKEMYKKAKESGKYVKTLRRDWAGMECDFDMAYAMVNHKEFFAEMSVTYLSDSYHELDECDGECMETSSPPLRAPAVIERVKNRNMSNATASITPDGRVDGNRRHLELSCRMGNGKSIQNRERGVFHFFTRLFRLDSSSRSILNQSFPHCNKFFPFTRGQLGTYDPELLQSFSEIWDIVKHWNDHDDQDRCNITCFAWK